MKRNIKNSKKNGCLKDSKDEKFKQLKDVTVILWDSMIKDVKGQRLTTSPTTGQPVIFLNADFMRI